MLDIILIVFISIIGLLALHELGHFLAAKKFGVKVEEFGFGYPPRLFGKKIGETIYSLNLLPFGAFVKIPEVEGGEISNFKRKPIWQRAIILFAGVAMFWIVAWVIFTVITILGIPTAISDEAKENFANPEIKIINIAENSPAELSGIKLGDTIVEVQAQNTALPISKVKEVQDFIDAHRGEEISLTVQRGGEERLTFEMIPRIQPPENEGAIGISLSRVAIVKYPWWEAPFKGLEATYVTTGRIIEGFTDAISKATQGAATGVKFVGPIGIVSLMGQMAQVGIIYYLQFIAIIAIHLAIFNLLPIPAIDGGRILFLGIEQIKGSPINQRLEQGINSGVFIALIILMIFVTFKDVQRFF
ncbi:MAG: M50 family metallopeptidase [bacterium]